MSEQTPDADDLLERATGGDAAAMDALMQRHLPGLRAFVRLHAGRLIRDREASTDLVQSVCREVLQRIDRLQYGGASGFKRWLYRTALRKIADRRDYYQAQRRDVRREVMPAELDGSAADVLDCYGSFCSPSRHASAREELQRVEAAFDDLPENYREVIVSARLLGLSHGEIATQMGKSEGAIRTMLSRATAQLAENLDRDAV